MPAKDRYHDMVVHALVTDGWRIANEQFFVNFPGRRLWIDIRAAKNADNRAILVEVKGFEGAASAIEYLAAVIGKYVLYRAALTRMGIDTPLYLAVPVPAYIGILSEPIGKLLIEEVGIPLLVFD